jgi:hypothetical protein
MVSVAGLGQEWVVCGRGLWRAFAALQVIHVAVSKVMQLHGYFTQSCWKAIYNSGLFLINK